MQSFPAPEEKRRISTGGGSLPRWRRDGKEILYVVSGRTLMSVEVETVPVFEAGPPRRLFEVPMASTFYYDVTSDGLHFLAALSVGEEPSASLTLVCDWATSAASRC